MTTAALIILAAFVTGMIFIVILAVAVLLFVEGGR